jgi:hypothetical protein
VSVTLSQATTEVRSLLNEPTAIFWTDAQIQSWINQGCQDVARRGQTLWELESIDTTANVQNFDLPANFISLHRVEFSPTNSNQTYSLEYRGYNTMDDIWGILMSLPAAYPQYVTIWGSAATGLYIRLYPVPGQNGTLNIFYYRDAALAVNPTDNLDVLAGWEDLVYDYAVFKALRADRDPRWQDAKQLYEMAMANQMNVTRNMTDLGENITSGIQQWPAWQYGAYEGGMW